MSKIIRKFFSVSLSILILVASTSFANALDETEPTVQPRYTGLSYMTVGINISSSGGATCTGYSYTHAGYTASMTLKIQKSSNDSSWSTLKTWSDSSETRNLAIEKVYYVLSGYYYRTQCIVKVYNSDGKLIETVTKNSPSKYF